MLIPLATVNGDAAQILATRGRMFLFLKNGTRGQRLVSDVLSALGCTEKNISLLLHSFCVIAVHRLHFTVTIIWAA